MNGIHIPTDILLNIFKHLEKEVEAFTLPKKRIGMQSKDLIQCQLTCKNWSTLVRNKIYECVVLKNVKQFDKFVYTLLNNDAGPSVEQIALTFEINYRSIPDLLFSFEDLVYVCTNLKRIYIESSTFNLIWDRQDFKMIKPILCRFELIPSIMFHSNTHLREYNEASYHIDTSTHELMIHVSEVEPIEQDIAIRYFASVNALYFRFQDDDEVYKISRYIKNYPLASSIEITYEGSHMIVDADSTNDIKVPKYAFPFVKQLQITYILYDVRLYTYLMETFPNLNNISLRIKAISNTRGSTLVKTSTDVTIRFIYYLMNISTSFVPCIPVFDLDYVLQELYDKHKTVKSLGLRYKQINQMGCSSYLSLWTNNKVEEKLNIGVNYDQSDVFILPRIGFIEHSGSTLRYLNIDMGLDFKLMRSMKTFHYVDFPYLLFQCPHLRTIRIRSTLLHHFGSNLQSIKERYSFQRVVGFYQSLIHHSFLPHVSSYVSFIDTFVIESCQFIEPMYDSTNITIDMPDTELMNIIYDDFVRVEQFHLKLEKTEDNSTAWLCGNKDYYEESTEHDYERSLRNKKSLSLYIRCKDFSTLNIRTCRFSVMLYNPLF